MHLDPLTIVFGLVALVTLWKLWTILGTRTGFERPPRNPFTRPNAPAKPSRPRPQPVALPGGPPTTPALPDPARWSAFIEPNAGVEAGLDAIAAADANFSAEAFLGGAKSAYEAVLTAFAAGDRKKLQPLLAPDVLKSFEAALAEREATGARQSTAIVSIDEAKIAEARLEGRQALVAVRFRSQQIVATHAADGSVVDGSAEKIVEVRDLWSFARDVRSRDPNWKLAGTAAGH